MTENRERTFAVKFVIAEDDAYIERDGAPDISELWPGSQVLSLPNVGHVLAFLRHASQFRHVIAEQMEQAAKLDDERRNGGTIDQGVSTTTTSVCGNAKR